MSTFSSANIVNNNIITKPYLISKEDLSKINSTTIGFNPDVAISLVDESVVNFKYGNPSSPKLLNYVEPYMIAGFQKTLFYTEVNTGLNVNDKVFIINGPYDSNALIKTNKYKRGRDGYKVLYIDNCRIVLDIDYVGDLPSSELNGDKPEVFDDFIKVYYINDVNDFIHVNRQISTRNDSVDYKFNKHQNNIIYSKYYPGFNGWGKNNGLQVGTEGFYIKDDENWVSITSDFLTGSYSIASATGSNNKILIVNGSFTSGGIEFKEDSVYKYNTSEYAWEVDIKHENNNPAIITKSNFRDGIFNGKFNGGLYGSSEKRIKWESVSAEWNSGTLLNTVWKEGIMNSLYTQYTSYYAEFDSYDIPFQKVTNPDNNGYGYNFIINSEIQNAVINNGNVSNCLLGQGTYSIVEQYIKHSIDFGNFDSGITTNKALFDNCKFINANIENTEVRNSRSINSRFNNIKSVNSHYQTSVFTNSKFISDNIIKVLDYDAFKYSQNHTNSSLTQMVYKFYINKRSYEKFKIKDTFYIKGLKINDKSNSVLNFFDKKFKIGPWTEYTDDFINGTTEYGKRGFEYSAFISTPEENKYTYNLNIANTQGNTITGLKDGEYYSVDIFVSYKDTDDYTDINNFNNIDFSNAYIVNSDFESGIFENSVWNNGNFINYNNDVNISNTNKNGFYDLVFDNYNNQNNIIKANISLGKETDPGYLDINEIVFLNAVDYDTKGKVATYSITNTGTNYTSGIYQLTGGSGFGMSMNIIADPIGAVTTFSYTYNNRNRYNAGLHTTTTTNGSATGLTVTVTVDNDNAIVTIVIVDPGVGYINGDVIQINDTLLDVASFTVTNTLLGKIKTTSTIESPGLGYKEGDILQIPLQNTGVVATLLITGVLGTTLRLPDSYKIIEKTNNGNTIYLECLDDNVNIFQNLTGGKFSTLGAYNRYGYLHKAKFSKSVIQSGIFKRSFFKECTIGNEAYDVSDKDFKDLDNKRNLLITDTIFSNTLNTLSKATYMNSFVIGNGDKWVNGILYNSIWNGMTFQSGLVKESNWLDGTFENGVFYNSKSFDYNLTAPTYDTLNNSYNSTYYTAKTLNNRYSWRNGIFNGGEFYKSDWENGTFNKGKFYNSKFYNGVINGGFIGDINIGDTYVFNALINYTTVDNSKLVAMKYIKTQKSDILWVDGVFNSGEFGTDNQSSLNTAVWKYGIFNGGRFINNGRWENGIFNGGKFLSYYKWNENDNGILLSDGSAVKYGLAIDTNSDKYSWVDGIFNGGEFGSGSSGPNSNWFAGEFNDGIFQGRIWNSGIFSYGKFTGSNTQTIIGGALNADGTTTPQYTNSNTAISNFISGNYYGLWRSGYVTDLKDKYVDKKNYTTLKRASDTTKDNKRTLIENTLWAGGTFDHTKAVMVNSIWLDGVFNNGTFTNSSFNPYLNVATTPEFNLNDGCIWNNGTFNGGDFYISKWNNGIFNSGTAIGMIWNNGTANYMNAYNVFWNNGLWRNGNWKGSDFYLEEDGTVKDNYTKQILFRGMSFSNTTYTHVWNIFKEEKMSVNKPPMITNGNLITSNPEEGTEDDTPPTAPITFTSVIAGPPADTTPPTAPNNGNTITVTEITTNSGKLSWTPSTDNVGVTGYNIYQTGIGRVGTVTTLFFYATGLSGNTPYSFTVTAIDNAGNESSPVNASFTTLDDSLTITSSAPYYSYSDGTFVGIDSFSGNLDFAHGQPNEVITLLLVLTSNTTPWSEVNFFDVDGILISPPLNASNTIRNGTITLDANGARNALYWGIGIPTCSCKVTITGRSSGLGIPSANSTNFSINRP